MQLVVIGCAKPKYIPSFIKYTGFKHKVLCDPKRELYKALDLLHGLGNAAEVNKSEHIHVGIGKGIKNQMSSTIQSIKDHKSISAHNQGDVEQQGGAFVIGPGDQLHYAHRDLGMFSHAPINTLLVQAGLGELDFTLPQDRKLTKEQKEQEKKERKKRREKKKLKSNTLQPAGPLDRRASVGSNDTLSSGFSNYSTSSFKSDAISIGSMSSIGSSASYGNGWVGDDMSSGGSFHSSNPSMAEGSGSSGYKATPDDSDDEYDISSRSAAGSEHPKVQISVDEHGMATAGEFDPAPLEVSLADLAIASQPRLRSSSSASRSSSMVNKNDGVFEKKDGSSSENQRPYSVGARARTFSGNGLVVNSSKLQISNSGASSDTDVSESGMSRNASVEALVDEPEPTPSIIVTGDTEGTAQ